MDPIVGITLGIVQGLTEFIPVSSSGHLILARDVLELPLENTLAFDAVLQLATSVAILIYFWRDLRESVIEGVDKRREGLQHNLIVLLAVATVPGVILGFLFEGAMETVLRNPLVVAGALVAGALLMWGAELFVKKIEKGALTVKKGVAIGFFQALALVPGMSRSGSTIAGGMFMGLTREKATRFAFLLGFPILFGSGIKKLLDLGGVGFEGTGLALLLGSLSAFIVGLGAIHFLISYLKNHTLNIFVIYRLALALVICLFLVF